MTDPAPTSDAMTEATALTAAAAACTVRACDISASSSVRRITVRVLTGWPVMAPPRLHGPYRHASHRITVNTPAGPVEHPVNNRFQTAGPGEARPWVWVEGAETAGRTMVAARHLALVPEDGQPRDALGRTMAEADADDAAADAEDARFAAWLDRDRG